MNLYTVFKICELVVKETSVPNDFNIQMDNIGLEIYNKKGTILEIEYNMIDSYDGKYFSDNILEELYNILN